MHAPVIPPVPGERAFRIRRGRGSSDDDGQNALPNGLVAPRSPFIADL